MSIEIHPHPTRSSILPLLHSHLPNSIPLYRRIQHALVHDDPSQFHYLATFPPSSIPDPDATSPWLIAYVNLFRGRETQIFIYSSLERQSNLVSSSQSSSSSSSSSPSENKPTSPPETLISELNASDEEKSLVRTQLLSLLSFVKKVYLPEYLTYVDQVEEEKDITVKIPAPPRGTFLLGTVHTGLFALLTSSGSYFDSNGLDGPIKVKIHRHDLVPYMKYLIHQDSFNTISDGGDGDGHSLPEGYSFLDSQNRPGFDPRHFALVGSRTAIPRSPESLANMSGVALYYRPQITATSAGTSTDEVDDSPIGWAFIGYDGALATLHVEPEHRGQGLAIHLARETLRRGILVPGGVFDQGRDDDGKVFAHVEASMSNLASRRVIEKVGGRMAWTVTWTVLELI